MDRRWLMRGQRSDWRSNLVKFKNFKIWRFHHTEFLMLDFMGVTRNSQEWKTMCYNKNSRKLYKQTYFRSYFGDQKCNVWKLPNWCRIQIVKKSKKQNNCPRGVAHRVAGCGPVQWIDRGLVILAPRSEQRAFIRRRRWRSSAHTDEVALRLEAHALNHLGSSWGQSLALPGEQRGGTCIYIYIYICVVWAKSEHFLIFRSLLMLLSVRPPETI